MLRVTKDAENVFKKKVKENDSPNLIYRIFVMGFG